MVIIMSVYARIADERIVEIIEPMLDLSGHEYPLHERFTSEFCEACVDITGLDPEPQCGWLYDGKSFSAPV